MSHVLEFTRHAYEEALGWYKSAESKAQILLGILGTFSGLISALILGNPVSVKEIIGRFNIWIIIAISLAFIGLCYGIFSCYMCLYSRIRRKDLRLKGTEGNNYPFNRLLFFGFHAYHDPTKLTKSLISIRTEEDEIKIYSSQIVNLSKNVMQKHIWINRGFFSISIAIGMMLLTTILYIIQLKTD
jgi:hypothetical protein